GVTLMAMDRHMVINARTVYPVDFAEEDTAQDFALDFEVSAPFFLTHRFGSTEEVAECLGKLALRKFPSESPLWRWSLAGQDRTFLERHGEDIAAQLVAHPLSPVAAPEGASEAEVAFFEKLNQWGATDVKKVSAKVVLAENSPSIDGSRGNSTPYPSLRRLFVEKIGLEAVKQPEVAVRRVDAQYAWRRPGERQVITVEVEAKEAQVARLVVRDVSGLGASKEIFARQVSLAPGEIVPCRFEWDIPTDAPWWGHEIVAEAFVDGEAVSSAVTYFALHPKNNAVFIPYHMDHWTRVRWHHPTAAKPNVANQYEHWAPTPYDSAGMLPEDITMPYAVGNSSKYESIDNFRKKGAELGEQGIAYAFYLEAHGTGSKAWDIYFAAPEKIAHVSGYISDIFRIKHDAILEKFRQARLKDPNFEGGADYDYPHMGFVMLNLLFKENMDIIINGHIELMKLAPFIICRWDNATPLAVYNHNVLGENFGLSQEELDKVSVANVERYLSEIRAVHPNFEVGYNHNHEALISRPDDPKDFEAAYKAIEYDKVTLRLLADEAYILEEGWGHSFEVWNDYKIVALNYLRATVYESAAYFRAGGHHGHMHRDNSVGFAPDDIYQQTFSLLGGAHNCQVNYGPMPESDYDLGVYAARFSEFYWNPKMRPIDAMEDKIEVDADADLWCAETGFELDLPGGGKRYVVSVINPPVTEKWLENRYGLLPDPVEGPIPVRVALPDGFRKVTSATLLENSPRPEAKPLPFEQGGGAVIFELPTVTTFKTVVLEFAP
ncbi:MAG: hypothetical protein FWF84_04335, partial [Kiritimatiellaeota bacterium]|nr:hypothetical protein [Kiritimatiellota bacterium]